MISEKRYNNKPSKEDLYCASYYRDCERAKDGLDQTKLYYYTDSKGIRRVTEYKAFYLLMIARLG